MIEIRMKGKIYEEIKRHEARESYDGRKRR